MQDGNYNPYGGISIEGKIQIVGKDPFLGYNRLMTISLGQDLVADRLPIRGLQ